MINKQSIKIFLLTFGINFVTYLGQNYFIGIPFANMLTKSFLVITGLVSLLEYFILDRFIIEGGLIQPR